LNALVATTLTLLPRLSVDRLILRKSTVIAFAAVGLSPSSVATRRNRSIERR